MTSDRRFEQDLPDLMAQLAPRQVPDYRDDIVRQTARTRQRPAWTFPERWLPMDITLAPARGRPRVLRTLVAVLLVALLAAALLVAYVGSRPHRVPPPFGPAVNGSLFFHDGKGAIVAMDSVTATPRTVVMGAESFAYPLPSRDGRLIEFDHTANGISQLYVSNQDGSNVHPLAGTYKDWTVTDWSADSTAVGIVSSVDGAPSITILKADGSDATTLRLDVGEVHTFWYLADGRIALSAGAKVGDPCNASLATNVCTLFVVNADGTGLHPILAADRFNSFSTNPSPDGRSVLYVRFTDAEPGGLHIVDIATGTDHRVAGDTIPSQTMNVNQASFSPDGSHILFDFIGETETFWAVVPVAGGPIVKIGPAWTSSGMPEAAFSPDGMSVLAAYPQADGTTKVLLLDPSGKTPDQEVSIPATYLPPWQRAAP